MKSPDEVEPEYFALRSLAWQLFVTLTFAPGAALTARLDRAVTAWLRDVVATQPHLHWSRVLWVARFEVGRGGRGHFHLCIAGLPARATEADSCAHFAGLWNARAASLAEVAAYDPTRDGLGYVLKIPWNRSAADVGASSRGASHPCEPMLSRSILTLRRFKRR